MVRVNSRQSKNVRQRRKLQRRIRHRKKRYTYSSRYLIYFVVICDFNVYERHVYHLTCIFTQYRRHVMVLTCIFTLVLHIGSNSDSLQAYLVFITNQFATKSSIHSNFFLGFKIVLILNLRKYWRKLIIFQLIILLFIQLKII